MQWYSTLDHCGQQRQEASLAERGGITDCCLWNVSRHFCLNFFSSISTEPKTEVESVAFLHLCPRVFHCCFSVSKTTTLQWKPSNPIFCMCYLKCVIGLYRQKAIFKVPFVKVTLFPMSTICWFICIRYLFCLLLQVFVTTGALSKGETHNHFKTPITGLG